MKFKSLGVRVFALCTFAFVFVYTGPTDFVDEIYTEELSFDSWRIGQGAPFANTFITNKETQCKITASVRYDPDTFPYSFIDGPDWNVTMTHGFTFSSADNTKKYKKAATGNRHVPSSHPNNGRGNTPMSVTMRVTVTSGSDSDSGEEFSKTIVKTITQDTIDQIRQEYVDHGIGVPPRSKFGRDRGDAYDNKDDYGYAIHEPARGNLTRWSTQFGHTIVISSGYRNPEHNRHHVGGASNSNHQYGAAIDGAIRDYDGDGNTSDDRQEMYDAAIILGLDPLDPDRYRSHIHIGG